MVRAGFVEKQDIGVAYGSFARAMRICQPPENSLVRRAHVFFRKSKPNITLRTLASDITPRTS